jgi:hypothetical protein
MQKDLIKLLRSFGKSAKKQQATFLELTYSAVEQYVAGDDYRLLNELLHATTDTAFEAPTQRLVREVSFHRFDKENNAYSGDFSPSQTRIDTIKAEWLNIYLKWQEGYTGDNKRETVKRDALTSMTEKLESIANGADKLSTADKQALYLKLLAIANNLQ